MNDGNVERAVVQSKAACISVIVQLGGNHMIHKSIPRSFHVVIWNHNRPVYVEEKRCVNE